MDVGAHAAPPLDDVLERVDAVPVLGDGGVIENVRRHEFVDDIQVASVVDLL